jgi:hypothetical protein
MVRSREFKNPEAFISDYEFAALASEAELWRTAA